MSLIKMAMCRIIGVLLCVNYVVGGSLRGLSPQIEVDVDEAFQSYVKDYGKHYASKDERDMRKAMFLKNWKMIEHHNSQNRSYTMKVNQFADRTDEELIGGGALPDPRNLTKVAAFPYSSEEVKDLAKFLPKNFDMRHEGYVSSVKDQGLCAACWAFATAGAVEAALTRMRGDVINLSEQALIDCVPPPYDTNGGCEGNSLEAAFDYIQTNGLPTDDEYSYKAKTGSCHASHMTTTYKIESYMQPTPGDPEALKVALYFHGPVAVQMHLSENLRFFDEGIFYEADCNAGGWSSLNHALVVVGYGSSEGVDYWVLKNSYGTDWGKDGYALISAKDDNCFIMTYPWVPLVSE